MLRVDILTTFPDMFSPLDESIVKRARNNGIVEINIHNLRDYTSDRHRSTDDQPFGGGPGMVMKPEPIFKAVRALKKNGCRVVLMSPQGTVLDQRVAEGFTDSTQMILICGHYEGVDERVQALITDEVSIGDYILTGGEIPAMVLTDCVVRLLPGAVGNKDATADESFSDSLLEYPHYTRPADFEGMQVPEVLLSGNHAAIASWRSKQKLIRTMDKRPDLRKKGKSL